MHSDAAKDAESRTGGVHAAPLRIKHNWRWPALVAGFVMLALTALLSNNWVATALGILRLELPFFDWLALLTAGDAHRAGADVYSTPNPFDPFGRPHVYGPWWLLLGSLGFTAADRWWMGGLVAIMFVVVAAWMLAPSTRERAALAAAMLVSPPVMLGLERANNDLVVFLMLVVAAWMLGRWPRAGIWGAVATVVLAAALKIYPVAALAALPAAPMRRVTMAAAVTAGIGACAAIAWWYRVDYMRMLAVVPSEVSFFTYGFKVLVALSRNIFTDEWQVALGIAAGLALGGSWLGPRLRALWDQVPLHGGTAFAYVAGASSWVFCYFANTNLPYRAVLLVLPARLWLREWRDGRNGPVARRCFTLLLLLLWMTCVTEHVRSWVERSGERLFPLWRVVVAFEQTLALVVTVALLLSLAGWAARHWRAWRTEETKPAD